MSDATDRIFKEAMQRASLNAMDAAIDLCEMLAASGHGADCCVAVLRDFKEKTMKAPTDKLQ